MYRSRLPQIAVELEAAMRAAERAAAELVAESARDRVPVRSGDLRDSIHLEDGDGGTYVIAGNEKVFYGHIVEHGGARTPPRPFLIPAAEERRADAVAIATAALRRIV